MFGIVGAGTLGLLGFFLPEMWLSRRIKKRQKEILLAVPDTLDLLTISVKAGLSFDGALSKVVEKVQGALSDEFRRALAEIRVGKVRREALRDIVGRNRCTGVVQFHRRHRPGRAARRTDRQGAPGSVRAAAHRASPAGGGGRGKAPIKMLFPLVGCIFPSMFIVILGRR
jgi:tight adherence protein C